MFVLITLAVILFGIKFSPKGTFYEDSFSVGQTRALKGIFALAVMFHHLYGYVLPSFLSLKYFRDVGFLMVGGFFLISGYGLMYGVKNKSKYLKGFFRKRILPLVVTYYVIDIFYIIIKYLLTLTTHDYEGLKFYIKESLFGLQLWFVPVMILLYVLFRLAFIGHDNRKNKYVSPIILTALVLVYIVLFTYTQHLSIDGKAINDRYGCQWNDTVLCFAVGMWYCILKDKSKAFLERFYYPVTVVSIGVFGYLFHKVLCLPPYVWPTAPYYLMIREICAVMFCIVTILLSMKVSLGNGLLNFCGDHSYEIYLSHAIFITVLRWGAMTFLPGDPVVYVQSDDLFATGIVVCTFVFSFVIHKLCGLVLKPLKKAKSKK